MDISVIIPTKDRGSIFDETLRSIVEALDGRDAEIIVVNDSKTSVPFIPKELANVRLVRNTTSGVAAARNLGASLALGELLIFMDDDFIIPPDSVAIIQQNSSVDPKKIHLYNWEYPPELQAKLNDSPFGRYLIQNGFTTVKGWLGNEWDDTATLFELKDGASYFLPMKKFLFDQIGGYDEAFPHAGAEDYDFVQRAKKIGVRFYLDKSLTLYHNERDKLDYISWMHRKKRNGQTIRIAVDMGYTELTFHYSWLKKAILTTLSKTKFFLFVCKTTIPRVRMFDFIYFKITGVLLAVYLFEGYTMKKNK